MNEYQRGFLEALQAVCVMGEGLRKQHTANIENHSLSQDEQNLAFNCACVLGCMISDVKQLGSQVHRGSLDPEKIAINNGNPYWWATKDGKGRN